MDQQVDDGTVLAWEEPATVIAAPGHTAGSIALLFPHVHVLLAGDAIASHDGQSILGVFNADPDQARGTFRRLAELEIEMACFGPHHGGVHQVRSVTASTVASTALPHAVG